MAGASSILDSINADESIYAHIPQPLQRDRRVISDLNNICSEPCEPGDQTCEAKCPSVQVTSSDPWLSVKDFTRNIFKCPYGEAARTFKEYHPQIVFEEGWRRRQLVRAEKATRGRVTEPEILVDLTDITNPIGSVLWSGVYKLSAAILRTDKAIAGAKPMFTQYCANGVYGARNNDQRWYKLTLHSRLSNAGTEPGGNSFINQKPIAQAYFTLKPEPKMAFDNISEEDIEKNDATPKLFEEPGLPGFVEEDVETAEEQLVAAQARGDALEEDETILDLSDTDAGVHASMLVSADSVVGLHPICSGIALAALCGLQEYFSFAGVLLLARNSAEQDDQTTNTSKQNFF